jgi:predicted DNA-binding protein
LRLEKRLDALRERDQRGGGPMSLVAKRDRFPFGQLLLTEPRRTLRLTGMEVRLKPETESRLNELALQSGRPADDLVEDAMAGYLSEVAEVRGTLDSRYDDIKSGRVKPIDGGAFFEDLRQREKELFKRRSPK